MNQHEEGGGNEYDRLYTKKEHKIPALIQQVKAELSRTRSKPVFASEIILMSLGCLKNKLRADERRAKIAAMKKADPKMQKGLKDAHGVLRKARGENA